MSTSSGVTVRGTPEAVSAVHDLSSIINGSLLAHFDNLRGAARVLVDPECWDGRTATEFRLSVWPTYERTLTDLYSQLDLLRARLAEIQADIQSAG